MAPTGRTTWPGGRMIGATALAVAGIAALAGSIWLAGRPAGVPTGGPPAPIAPAAAASPRLQSVRAADVAPAAAPLPKAVLPRTAPSAAAGPPAPVTTSLRPAPAAPLLPGARPRTAAGKPPVMPAPLSPFLAPVLPPVPPGQIASIPPPPLASAPPTAELAPRPSFDIVRVSARGTAVVAGRAAPYVEVALLDNGREIARTRADDLGQWVALPAAALPPGGQELTLASKAPGEADIAGTAPVVLVVPPPAAPMAIAAATAPLATASSPAAPSPSVPPASVIAVLLPPDAAPQVLSAPVAAGRVGLDLVDYDSAGAIRFSGTARAGSRVRLYVDDRPVGETQADGQGRWWLTPASAVAEGDHRLRVDALGIAGQVAARIELPFQRALLSPQEVLEDRVVVQPTQSLWRIARKQYGRGVRYTVIYMANREQIRDPDRIYPGQVLAVPPIDGLPAASMSMSDSLSKSR